MMPVGVGLLRARADPADLGVVDHHAIGTTVVQRYVRATITLAHLRPLYRVDVRSGLDFGGLYPSIRVGHVIDLKSDVMESSIPGTELVPSDRLIFELKYDDVHFAVAEVNRLRLVTIDLAAQLKSKGGWLELGGLLRLLTCDRDML